MKLTYETKEDASNQLEVVSGQLSIKGIKELIREQNALPTDHPVLILQADQELPDDAQLIVEQGCSYFLKVDGEKLNGASFFASLNTPRAPIVKPLELTPIMRLKNAIFKAIDNYIDRKNLGPNFLITSHSCIKS